MDCIAKYLTTKLQEVFKKFGITTNRKVQVVFQGAHGTDYSFREFRSLGKISGIEEIILNNIDLPDFTINFVNGNLNFIMKNDYVVTKTKQTLLLDDIYKHDEPPKKILVDFSSPNVAKDMHVGHLRSTIIGDSIARLFEKDNEVLRINHIGDFGLQFGMLVEYFFRKYGTDFSKIENLHLTNSDLQQFYVEAKQQFDSDEEFKKIAYSRVVELQSGSNQNVLDTWNYIKKISKISYDQIYQRLDIKLDEVGESFYQSMIPDLIMELEQKGLLICEDGRKIVKINGYKECITVVKSDGGYTYDTTDLAALKYRLLNLDVDEIYYVVDIGQSLHFQLVFALAKQAGWLTNNKVVKHIEFGMVLGHDGKRFRTREGGTVKLIDLLDASIEKSMNVVEGKRDFDQAICSIIAETIGYAAIKYSDLATVRTRDYVFSFDKMLALKGNTAPYMLYMYVRICSIMRNAGNLFVFDAGSINNLTLEIQEEIDLAKYILIFPEIIARLKDDLLFNNISAYLYKLSEKFAQFFKVCRCLQYDENKQIISCDNNRLLLCELTRKIMKECFDILGIQTIDRM